MDTDTFRLKTAKINVYQKNIKLFRLEWVLDKLPYH